MNWTCNHMNENINELIYSAVQIEDIQASKGQTAEIVAGNMSAGVSFEDALSVVVDGA